MYVTTITTNEYENVTNLCKDNENNTDINISTFLLTIPCGLSILCLISLMIYTLIKTLFTIK